MDSKQIFEKILYGINRIDIGRFDYHYIPFKSDFTKAILNSIIQTCESLQLDYRVEFQVDVSDEILKKYKRKKRAFTDVVIFNNEYKHIAIEIDSSFKKWSYKKLEILSEKGFDSFWLIWKRKTPGRELKWRVPSDIEFSNNSIRIHTHTFFAKEERTTP